MAQPLVQRLSGARMNLNNEVRDSNGHVFGFRCRECGGIFQSMWSCTCDGCREKERRHQELLAAIRSRPGSPDNQESNP